MEFNEGGQETEFRRARAEGRQPICVHCGEPLKEVSIRKLQAVFWKWSGEERRFIMEEGGEVYDRLKCENCETEDWDFVDNDFIRF